MKGLNAELKREWVCVEELLFDTHPALSLSMRFLAAILGGISSGWLLMKIAAAVSPLTHLETVFFCEWLLPLWFIFSTGLAFCQRTAKSAWKNLCFFVVAGSFLYAMIASFS